MEFVEENKRQFEDDEWSHLFQTADGLVGSAVTKKKSGNFHLKPFVGDAQTTQDHPYTGVGEPTSSGNASGFGVTKILGAIDDMTLTLKNGMGIGPNSLKTQMGTHSERASFLTHGNEQEKTGQSEFRIGFGAAATTTTIPNDASEQNSRLVKRQVSSNKTAPSENGRSLSLASADFRGIPSEGAEDPLNRPGSLDTTKVNARNTTDILSRSVRMVGAAYLIIASIALFLGVCWSIHWIERYFSEYSSAEVAGFEQYVKNNFEFCMNNVDKWDSLMPDCPKIVAWNERSFYSNVFWRVWKEEAGHTHEFAEWFRSWFPYFEEVGRHAGNMLWVFAASAGAVAVLLIFFGKPCRRSHDRIVILSPHEGVRSRTLTPHPSIVSHED